MSTNGEFDKTGSDTQKMLADNENFDELFKSAELTDDTTCGFWIFKGKFIQKFANKKTYIFLYGICGLFFSATFAYFNGTITTIEKRYKIPSRNTGFILVGSDISQLLVSAILSYYAGKGHRPRWIAFGLLTIVLACFFTALPHFIYGPGEDALTLTTEYGGQFNENITFGLLEQKELKTICRINTTNIAECEIEEGNLAPQILLFIAQMIVGIGTSLYYSIGVAYMDDNIKKSKTPALISLSYFIRMLGPAFGYTLVSFCLKLYISPSLTPTITLLDPRWLGAWWLGWIVLGFCILLFALPLGLLPKALPRAAFRKLLEDRKKRGSQNLNVDTIENETPSSLSDMMTTFKRVLKNKILMLNNVASIFQIFGSMAYWIFTPKYIETQYRQSASLSSLVTGTVAIAFSALGIFSAGFVLSKFKPSARSMAAWNVFVGILSVLGMLSYVYLGCSSNDSSMIINQSSKTNDICSSNCQCDYVKYSPVCGENNFTYISPCHAGCNEIKYNGSAKHYDKCTCISIDVISSNTKEDNAIINRNLTFNEGGKAYPGSCPVDCFKEFIIFLTVLCVNKFIGASGRASNFLISVRCVEQRDKTASMGLGLMLISLFALMPSPIFFGAILDSTCAVWGKTCSGTGNCWLYDGKTLRYLLNIITASFVAVGTLFDVGVWYYVKNLKIFDDNETEMKEIKKGESSGTNENFSTEPK